MATNSESPLAGVGPALIAEAIGTFGLIFVGCMAIGVGKFAYSDSGLLGIAWAHGLTIAVMASATMAISGGHLNPGVTAGLWIGKKISSAKAALYIVSQMAGAFVAALAAIALLPPSFLGKGNAASVGIPALHQSVSVAQGIFIEALATFMLVFVVYGTAVDKRAPKLSGLCIGLAVTLGVLWSGPLTGGAMNPARWFGPALATANFSNWEVWIVGPILGGMAAGVLYTAFLEQKSVPVAES